MAGVRTRSAAVAAVATTHDVPTMAREEGIIPNTGGVLGGLADVERDLIRARTAEGGSHVMARWWRMGRAFKLTEERKAEARPRRAEVAMLKELAKSYNVGRATISRSF